MNKFKEKFLQFVDSHAIVRRLEIENVISDSIAHTVKTCSTCEGNEELFLHLRRQADPISIYKLCKVLTSRNGYQNMIRLGQDMQDFLDLLTSMYDMCMYTYSVYISKRLVWLACSHCGVLCSLSLPCEHSV